jgi:virulence-associated protein VagC
MPATTARTFKSGNDEAIRLPEGYGFGPGTEVAIERDGDRVVLTALKTDAEADLAERHRRFAAMLADMAAVGPVPGPRQERDSDWWIERPFM